MKNVHSKTLNGLLLVCLHKLTFYCPLVPQHSSHTNLLSPSQTYQTLKTTGAGTQCFLFLHYASLCSLYSCSLFTFQILGLHHSKWISWPIQSHWQPFYPTFTFSITDLNFFHNTSMSSNYTFNFFIFKFIDHQLYQMSGSMRAGISPTCSLLYYNKYNSVHHIVASHQIRFEYSNEQRKSSLL